MEHRYKLRTQMLWGITLVAFGVAYLLQRDDPAAVGELWRYWPLVLIAFGINSMLPPTHGRRFVDGLSQVLFGAWFFATYEGIWGLTFRNSWPLLIIVVGLGLVLQPLAARYFDRNDQDKLQNHPQDKENV